MKWLLVGVSFFLVITAYIMKQNRFADCNKTIVQLPHAFTIDAELARTPSEQQLGLANRASLGDHQGMLFLFPSADRYAFWMKDTLIPLDIIWIKKNMVIDIQTLLPQKGDAIPSYEPTTPADTVLEVNAGIAKRVGLEIGDTIHWDTLCQTDRQSR